MISMLADPRSLPESAWHLGHAALKPYLSNFAASGSRVFIGNLETTVVACALSNGVLPATVNHAEYGNCYVCSPHTAYSLYAREEARLVANAPLRWTLKLAAGAAGRFLAALRFNKVVHINNWMLSTNLYPDLDGAAIAGITGRTISQFPSHFVCWRSLNRTTNGTLIDELLRHGYSLLPSRQVYIFDRSGDGWRKTYDARNDRSLLRKTEYVVEDPIALRGSDYERVAELYRLLYIAKYSALNPDFTPRYLQLCHESGAMRFMGLRSPEGIIDGIVGQFTVADVTSTPIIGYDTAVPQTRGLYRMLTTMVLEASIARGLTVNASSGAASFKRMRGGAPAIEYTAIYSKHLNRTRDLGIDSFAYGIRKAILPVMEGLRL